MTEIIDIHSHILPGLDDGPRAAEESLEMLKAAWEQGITGVIATPHHSGRYERFYPHSVKNSSRTELFQTEDALKELIEDGKFHQYVWNKIYKSSVINGILFEIGKTNEDEFWTYQIFGNARKIGLVTMPMYYYLQRNTSIMGEKYSLKRVDALEAKLQRQKYINENFPRLKNIAAMNLFVSCIYQGQMALLCLNGEELIKAKKEIESIAKISMKMFRPGKECTFSMQIWILQAKIYFWGTCRLRNFLRKGF